MNRRRILTLPYRWQRVIDWYVQCRKLIRALARKAADARAQCAKDADRAPDTLKQYMLDDLHQLKAHWLGRYPGDDHAFRNLGRHVGFCMRKDCSDIVESDLPDLEELAEAHLVNDGTQQKVGFEALLHPIISESSYELYRGGHLREAVLNSITALFDYIRLRTGTAEDGDRLIGKVFSLEKPLLTLSELQTESGQDDQKGFMQIFKGAYQGIRNPKAHSLTHDLTAMKAAQYLVFASPLARRIDEAQ
jgi:uncharacterized protein (TIGR02391 family)